MSIHMKQQIAVRNRIFEEYREKGFLTEQMTEELSNVGLDPYKQAVE